jgi:putative tryptophan/tyrosine transport system substrate-binding protein
MIDRRTFLRGLTFGALSAPFVGEAQQAGKVPRIGVLGPTPIAPSSDEGFRQGLAEFGYQNGRNLVIEYRHGEGKLLSGLAVDLVRLNVDVIYARGPAAVEATKGATRTIPVVAIDLESDPVAMGFVRGLAQPGGNITGVFLDLPELGGKQLQLLKEIEPQVSRVAVLGDPVLNGPQFEAMEIAARALGIEVQRQELRVVKDFERALDAAKKGQARAVLILSSPFVYSHRAQFGAVVVERRMPAVSMFTEFAESGGLLAYGPSVPEAARRCGAYVGRILQGSKPGEMPIERPQTFQLAVNLKTAKALGLTIPPSVLGLADKVIE